MPDSWSFRSVIELWETREAMASEIGARDRAVSKWWQRDTIPSGWWDAVLSTEKAKTSGLTSDILTRLAAREKDEVRA
jgi:hypothetical protein